MKTRVGWLNYASAKNKCQSLSEIHQNLGGEEGSDVQAWTCPAVSQAWGSAVGVFPLMPGPVRTVTILKTSCSSSVPFLVRWLSHIGHRVGCGRSVSPVDGCRLQPSPSHWLTKPGAKEVLSSTVLSFLPVS